MISVQLTPPNYVIRPSFILNLPFRNQKGFFFPNHMRPPRNGGCAIRNAIAILARCHWRDRGRPAATKPHNQRDPESQAQEPR